MTSKKWEPEELDGLSFRFNSLGYLIIELDYWCDPDKAKPEWSRAEKKKYQDKQWRREILRDWSVSSGDAFYPEFQVAPSRYIYDIGGLVADRPVVRGYDLGFRAPVCSFMQAAKSGRVAILRELAPKNIDSHNFRDLVRYASGEIELEQLRQDGRTRALHWVEHYASRYPPMPWFEEGTRFENFAGPECYAVRSIEGEHAERNDFEVFASVGIVFGVLATRVKAREEVVRRLLGMMPDGHPGIVFDRRGAPEHVKMMNGGLAYKKATKLNPMPNEPAKDGHFDNIHDAMGYGLINIAPVTQTTERTPELEPYIARSGREAGTRLRAAEESLDMTIDW